ncbi:MAG: hypothetical protein RBS56_04370 [Candidatus Gracilibacteria bacterium]|jgi:hypothetical protein|nr:hypothetical protein [Candidatus Gracilibacteria bacterium]
MNNINKPQNKEKTSKKSFFEKFGPKGILSTINRFAGKTSKAVFFVLALNSSTACQNESIDHKKNAQYQKQNQPLSNQNVEHLENSAINIPWATLSDVSFVPVLDPISGKTIVFFPKTDGTINYVLADTPEGLKTPLQQKQLAGTDNLRPADILYDHIRNKLVLPGENWTQENIQQYDFIVSGDTVTLTNKAPYCQNNGTIGGLENPRMDNNGDVYTMGGNSVWKLDKVNCVYVENTFIDADNGTPVQDPTGGAQIGSVYDSGTGLNLLVKADTKEDLANLTNLTYFGDASGNPVEGTKPSILYDPVSNKTYLLYETRTAPRMIEFNNNCGDRNVTGNEACDDENCNTNCDDCKPGYELSGTVCVAQIPDTDPDPDADVIEDIPNDESDTTPPDVVEDLTDFAEIIEETTPDVVEDTTPDQVCNNDGTCGAGETTANCPGDCPEPACNNNGTCDPGETTTNCPQDCKQISQECLDNVRLVISVAEGDCDITHCEFDPVTGYNVIYSGSGQELCRLLGTEEGKDTPWNLSAILREGDKTLDIMLEIKDITSKGFKSANINKLPGIGYSISKSGHNLIGKLCNNNICLRTGSEGSKENSYAYEDGEDLVMVLESIQSTWWAYLENKDDGRTFDLPDTPEKFTTEYRVSKKVFDALVADQPIIEVVENILDQGEDIGAEVAESGNGGGEDCGCNVRNPNKANHAGAILLLLVLLYVGAIKPGKKKSEQ